MTRILTIELLDESDFEGWEAGDLMSAIADAAMDMQKALKLDYAALTISLGSTDDPRGDK